MSRRRFDNYMKLNSNTYSHSRGFSSG